MMISTEVTLTKLEVEQLISEHLKNVHGLDVSSLFAKSSNNKFNGFHVNLKEIRTDVNKKHTSTTPILKEEKKVMI